MEKMGSNGIDLIFRGYRGRMIIFQTFRCFNVGRLMKVGKIEVKGVLMDVKKLKIGVRLESDLNSKDVGVKW